ncbi:hypothetical protein KFK09_022837 [Dendrobium nobile]|uniref:Uncharacterized protein n=1 Tax=Dendrobium nobile TaxID=94219 RepID=A0A8T3AKI1_DENNO|nr:hypothetical protein KFK09_022837 [Dendrobium nobile]
MAGETERGTDREGKAPKQSRSNSTFWGDEGAPKPVPSRAPTPAYLPHYYEMLMKRFDQLESLLETHIQQQQEQHDADMTWFSDQFASIHRYFQPPPPPPDQGPSYN